MIAVSELIPRQPFGPLLSQTFGPSNIRDWGSLHRKKSVYVARVSPQRTTVKAGSKDPAVRFGENSNIQDAEHTTIGTSPDKTTQALFESQHSHWHLEGIERRAPLPTYAIGSRGYDRIVGGREREAIHCHARKRFSLYIYPFPERRSCKEHRPLELSEFVE